MDDEQRRADELIAEGWTPYAPLSAPVAARCAFCGRAHAADLLVVSNADGSAAICEECCASHGEFFARQRGR
jgi:hypothetical protein